MPASLKGRSKGDCLCRVGLQPSLYRPVEGMKVIEMDYVIVYHVYAHYQVPGKAGVVRDLYAECVFDGPDEAMECTVVHTPQNLDTKSRRPVGLCP